MLYEWDDAKADFNLRKHGVAFEDVFFFETSDAVELIDDREEYGEVRYAVFAPLKGRLHCLVYTRRGDVVRVISLRRANRRERAFYERNKDPQGNP